MIDLAVGYSLAASNESAPAADVDDLVDDPTF
jgi:hypothetical protein